MVSIQVDIAALNIAALLAPRAAVRVAAIIAVLVPAPVARPPLLGS